MTTTFDPVDKKVLDYKEPGVIPPHQELQLDNIWGRLPNSRFMNVGRGLPIKVVDDATVVTTGDGKVIFEVTPEFDGAQLIRVRAYVTTVSSSGALTVQIRNVTQSIDMLSTAITIDQSELSSKTATTPAVVKTTIVLRDGDQIAVDVDGAGTGAKGLGVYLGFQ